MVIFIFSFFAIANHIKNFENKDPREVIIDDLLVNLYQFIYMKFLMVQINHQTRQLSFMLFVYII